MRNRIKHCHKPRRNLEQLEHRQLLHAGGISALLTLSFAPDGTDVSGHPSSLYSTFGELGTPTQWQGAITGAFHQWSKHTNADIGLVPDIGDAPFGTPERGSASFGDVRIGAAPLAEDVLAISLPSDNLALGSWASDIIFNSNVDWTSLDQLASVALHEAGHIFGLEHSSDPTSVMHVHGVSDVTTPSAADIANLQFLYGQRNLDANETTTANDTIDTPTDLASNLAGEMLSLSYGDISSADDVDFYRITTEDDIEGDVRIVVDNRGVSVADFVVKLYDEDQNLLVELDDRNDAGVFAIDFEFDDDEADFFISVELADNSLAVSGGYLVAVALDPEELEDDEDNEEYDDLDEHEFRFATQELGDYLLSNGDYLFSEEEDEDDDLESASDIAPRSFNAGRTWFEQVGSINGADVDVYRLESPEDEAGLQRVMTVNVQAITNLALAPTVVVRSQDRSIVESNIIRSSNGEHILQLVGVRPETDYFIEVSAEDPNGPAARGNYRLSVNFGSERVELNKFSEGTLTSAEPIAVRQLYVATPQLFHFLLSADPLDNEDSPPIRMELFDQGGTLVHQLMVTPGQTRSSANPLLEPGEYTVRVGFAEHPTSHVDVGYGLLGFAVANPLGVVPVDPTADPIYTCDGLNDQFCYPGGTTSHSPFFWDDFIQSYIDSQTNDQKDGEDSSSLLDWLWRATTMPTTPAPTTVSDAYRVYDQVLSVGQAEGLLSDAANTNTAPMVVRVDKLPQHGSLNMSPQGDFHYSPDFGFWGTDAFTYRVFGFDSGKWSEPANVELHIDQDGDANGDGEVNFTDFLQFARGFGSDQASWEFGDFDGNGMTDFKDFLILTSNFGKSVAIALPPPNNTLNGRRK